MGGPSVFVVIGALLCYVGGMPQLSDQRSASLPIRPFSQSDSREPPERPYVFSDRQTPAAPRQHQLNGREDNLYQSRAHSVQIQHGSTRGGSHESHRQAQDATRPKERKRNEEEAKWFSDLVREPDENDSRGHSSADSQNRGNRRSTTQQKRGSTTRGHSGGSDRTVFRMGNEEGGNASLSGKPANTMPPINKEEIVFPGPTRDDKLTPGKFAPQVGNEKPNCAQGSTFCESTDNYPSDYLKSVLKLEADAFKDFFGVDESNDLTQRIDITDETALCASVENVVYPKMAQNKEDKWLFVVNEEPYLQGVRVEKCLRQESECSLTEGFPLGYKTICRQKYIYRRMLALNEDGKTHSDMFRLPSCCACYVKSVGATGNSGGSR